MKLIIGASGAVGIPTIKNMIKSGHEFCVLSSNEESALKLRALGVVNVIVGDYREDGVLASVMRDVQSVCYIPARHIEDELEVGKSIVDAAKVVKLDHFLFCSAFQPPLQGLNHHWKQLLLEEYNTNMLWNAPSAPSNPPPAPRVGVTGAAGQTTAWPYKGRVG